jgi:Reversibly glycosylated polypeptide
MPKAALVLTTIFDPVILETYLSNFDRYGRLDDVEIVVIPDRKTPAAAFNTCHRLATQGLKVVCPTLEEQECYLKRIGLRPGFIPYNSDNRRNVGFLMALERQPDFLISIDDDNYCLDTEDYFSAHVTVLSKSLQHNVTSSATGFINVCDLLDFDMSATVYPRGYPYFARHKTDDLRTINAQTEIMINAGLWLKDPDVDAITWLGLNPCARSFRNESVVLDSSSWSPVNSQNTALRTALIPAYYFVRMGYPINGMAIDRYGDIFSGFFVLACAKHLGGTARFGTPIADHRRNRHDYLRDASAEWHAILLLEDVLRWLVGTRLEGSNCFETYLSLAEGLEQAVEEFQGPVWNDASRGFFHQMAYCMRTWVTAARRVAAA